MKSITLVSLVLITVACASSPPPVEAPQWEAVPLQVVEGLCRRLQMDAATSGTSAIVETTVPLIDQQSLAGLARLSRGRKPVARQNPVDLRPLRVDSLPKTCEWRLTKASATPRHDEVLIELSSPIANPFDAREAGMFARVSLGGEHPSLYWIALVPAGSEWGVRFVSVVPQ